MADQIAEFCGNCGTPNIGKTKFCEKCGENLSVASPTVRYPISQQATTPTERDTKIAAVKAQIISLQEEITRLERHVNSWIVAILGGIGLIIAFGVILLIIAAIMYHYENKEIEQKKDVLFRMESELNRLEGY